MDDEVFEQLRWDGAAAIPSNFREKISNVAFFIKDKPTGDQQLRLHLGPNTTMLGLYQGVPQAVRGIHYHAALTDRITIFKEPIFALAGDPERIKQIVTKTV